MRRIDCPERDDWRLTAEAAGFDFHTIDGERYWDERGYYAFTLDEIERGIETPTGEIDAMCIELVGSAVDDESTLARLKIPEAFWPLISESWHRDDPSLYGRIDLSFDGRGPAKLLEYNADTPTSIFEAAVFQWTWLEQAIERRIIPARRPVQFHPRASDRGMEEGRRGASPASDRHDRKPRGCRHAGLSRGYRAPGRLRNHDDRYRRSGLRDDGGFVDLEDRAIELAFKLYPWEWMFHDAFGAKLKDAPTRWVEPPWKAILSNKGILPLLWEMFPNHPNLLPAWFEDDPKAAQLGGSYVRKPLYSREGANVTMVSAGATLVEQQGPYGAEGFIRQAFAPLPNFAGSYPVVGSWLVDHTPCGLSIREDENPITGNTSRFLPHAIL